MPDKLKDSLRTQHEKSDARLLSIKEGAAASASSGLGGSQITPFALAINSTPFHIGLISSISSLFAPFAEIYGSKLMTHQSRKRIVVHFVLLQSLMWLPIASLCYFFWKGLFAEYLPYALIVLYLLLALVGSIAGPAWFSWMGDIVNEKERGAYFSKRNRISGIVSISTALIGAFFLDVLKTKGFVLLGFAILFALSFTFRFISFLFFRKQFSPSMKIKKGDYIPFFSFFKKFTNYRNFVAYRTLFYTAQMIASPFFAVYMLKDLNFSYSTFMIVSLSGSIFYLLFIGLAGKFSDKYGNVKLIKLAGILSTILPLLWLFIKSPWGLIFIPSLIGGIADAGLTIGVTNFTYDALPQKQRGAGVAYANVLIGIGGFLGSLIGGILMTRISPLILNAFFLVIVISVFFRFMVNLVFFSLLKIKEEKKAQRLPPMRINFTHPFKSIHHEIGWFRHVFR